MHTRSITIRYVQPDARELDLDVVSHGVGLISGWASGADIGGHIGSMGPVGALALPEATDHLKNADQTGPPGVARHLADMAPGATGRVICKAESDAALGAYLPKTDIEVKAISSANFSAAM